MAVAALFLTWAPAAGAEVFVVNDLGDAPTASCGSPDDTCTLRAAVIAANALPGPDDIVLPAGTIELSITGDGGADRGDLDVTDELTVTGAGMTATTVRAAPGHRHFLSTARLSIADLTLSGGNPGDWGGAILDGFGGNLTLDGVALTGNRAGSDGGGALASPEGTPTITGSRITDNRTTGDGGGIYALNPTIVSSEISNNTASTGGGGVSARDATIQNSTISGNAVTSATGPPGGGGVLVSGSDATIVHTTITNNTSNAGADGVGSTAGNLALANSIVAGNGDGPQCFLVDAPDDAASNVDGDGTCSTSSEPGGPVERRARASAVAADPQLGPLAFNGGATRTHQTLSGSPALDSGSSAFCLPVDQRGVARPQGSGCDAGAYELVPLAVTTPIGTFTATTPTAAGCVPRSVAHRFKVKLKKRIERSGRLVNRRSRVTVIRFRINGTLYDADRSRPFVTRVDGSRLVAGTNVLQADVRLRVPVTGETFSRRLNLTFQGCA